MSLKTAILFNGAASYIAQEAGILDLLLGNVEGVPGVDLNIQRDVKFIGGLSSGALMTFIVNAAFCENPPLIWEDFKKDILFPLTTKQVYNNELPIPFDCDTSPLNSLLTDISKQANYHTLRDLPFESAILTLALSITLVPPLKTCWLTNIPKVAQELPRGINHVYESIKNYHVDLELVSSLMCSTAIPITFQTQKLYYKDGAQTHPITHYLDVDARFADGGTEGAFKGFQEFFDTYEEKFDKIYFISPDFPNTEQEVYKLLGEVDLKSAAEKIHPERFIDRKSEFVKELKEYNCDGHLANEIYYCQPEVSGYSPLNFDQEEEQYNDTISWGQSHPDKIAININSITE